MKLSRLIILAILCFGFKSSIACTCMYVKKVSAEALMFDGIVFSGKIIDLKTICNNYGNGEYPDQKMATFVVDTWFSSHDISDTVTVYTGTGGGDCGLQFNLDESWLIYAYEHSGTIQSSICTASMRASSKSYPSAMKFLRQLKSKSGRIKEELEGYNESYILSGNVKEGKPVGGWIRLRGADTIAIFNFDKLGRRVGYQREYDENYDETFESYYERTDSYCKLFNGFMKLNLFYELKDGKRNGKYEMNWGDNVVVTTTFVNGRLTGEWTSWHKDTAISDGKIITKRIFEDDQMISSKSYDESGKQLPPTLSICESK